MVENYKTNSTKSLFSPQLAIAHNGDSWFCWHIPQICCRLEFHNIHFHARWNKGTYWPVAAPNEG